MKTNPFLCQQSERLLMDQKKSEFQLKQRFRSLISAANVTQQMRGITLT